MGTLINMKRRAGVLLVFFIALAVAVRLYKLDFPLTLNEVKESYTAYSVLKTGRDTNGELPGLFFRSDNNFLSSVGVYSKIPAIAVFGLTPFAVRLPSVIFGLVSVWMFYQLAVSLTEKRVARTAAILFAFSPFLIQTNIFDLGHSASILFVLASLYFLLKKDQKLLLFTSILSVLSSFSALIISVAVLVVWVRGKGSGFIFASAVIAALVGLIALKTHPALGKFLVRETVIEDSIPSSYTHLIDRRIAEGFVHNSPLIRGGLNLGRLTAYNKPFYTMNQLAKGIIEPFDYASLTSARQAGFILDKEARPDSVLPKFFFWELPFFVVGAIILFRKAAFPLKAFALSVVISTLVFKEKGLVYVIPLVALSYSNMFYKFKPSKKLRAPTTLVLSGAALFIFFSYVSFFDLLYNHENSWLGENDLRQYEIWKALNEEIEQNKVMITDRFGEPVHYYLYYEAVDPAWFGKSKIKGPTTDGGTERINGVSDVLFGSFKYFESDRKKDQLWVGLAGEFVGENRNYKHVTSVVDGEVFKKIKGVKQKNQFLGDELWFVRTIFEEE